MTATPNSTKTRLDKRTAVILIAMLVLLIGLVVGLILVNQPQKPQKQAAAPAPSCPMDGFLCTWDLEEGVTYTCAISEITATGKIEVARPQVKKDPASGKGLCTYSPQVNKRYECTVRAVKFAGCEASASAQSSCVSIPVTNTPVPTATTTPSATPSATPRLTPTITPTPTPTPTPTVTITLTPTPTKTPTPGPSATLTPTPKLTDIVVVNVTGTSAPTKAPAQASPTTIPTLPVSGGISQLTIAFLFIGVIAIGIAFAL
ncbi:hypothetical protein A3B02_02080 [Candidatus Roizmanbacteria bacterium RIFCSPLOWO2_01_FULL_42_14]|uniref:Uncharacterized protein n=1 Tax=Candidatus Roizmanbacteria bacterium RIFCSPLOWO2_01_FULL_42_14 TaxID=1802068 RepID=A0A1F7JAB9_9BACT|nr:MAG: hypothetical protein A3B02_02080 [Candidatus Roizmanbacteria bacterium RIFCSPLOWO2_01_FULL_42_14]